MNKPRCPDCDMLVTKIDQADLAEMGLADTRKDRSQLYRCIPVNENVVASELIRA